VETQFNFQDAIGMFKSMLDRLENPKPIYDRVFDVVINPGWKKNIQEKGKHWGNEWPERGYLTKLFRGYQQGTPDRTLFYTGALSRSLEHRPLNGSYRNGMECYSTVPYANEIQKGKTGPVKVTFKKQGRLKKDHTVTLKGVPARDLSPDHLGPGELSSITRICIDEYQKASNKRK
jgi:hypothetical protein